MWIKAVVLGGSGIIFPNLAVWTMAGLGITIAFHSSRNRLLGVAPREETDNEPDDDILGNILSRLRLIIGREEKVNEIGRLPDEILGNIVSRLMLVEASRTSILSRRWRNIWTMRNELIFKCVSVFDINKVYHIQVADNDKQRLFEVVDQCLQLYSDQDRKLTVFCLYCCILNGHTCHLERWMQTLARLGVESLYLGHVCVTQNLQILEKEFTFSFKLIDGLSRLRYLHLVWCFVETSFVGQCISLQRIYMWCVPLLSHQVSDILMSCPNLRHLYMGDCELPLNLRISGPNLKLEYLSLHDCCNVTKIEISGINLTTVLIGVVSEVEISFSSVPKIKTLHLRAPNYDFGYVSQDLLPELKCLLIQTSFQMLQLPRTFQVFHNVRELYLVTRDYPYPEGREKVDLWNFSPVLVACPSLEEFYLRIGGPVCEVERIAQWPVLRHEHLKHMELSGFSNMQNELEFAKFILRSAQVLQSFMLRVSPRKYDGKRFYFEDETDSKQIDAQVAEAVCADLKGHALSMLAVVKLL